MACFWQGLREKGQGTKGRWGDGHQGPQKVVPTQHWSNICKIKTRDIISWINSRPLVSLFHNVHGRGPY